MPTQLFVRWVLLFLSCGHNSGACNHWLVIGAVCSRHPHSSPNPVLFMNPTTGFLPFHKSHPLYSFIRGTLAAAFRKRPTCVWPFSEKATKGPHHFFFGARYRHPMWESYSAP
eukprot:TRINITY_DN1353_c1_g1_i1.p1 TRINITY_DN1353_c1_g1~~TRINITY_DN1353_c1_g1_i1.p1  ORF type:complete len:113 (-),score=10.20 TRINITY_DN1353_c1_g1_i1:486-824(-)